MFHCIQTMDRILDSPFPEHRQQQRRTLEKLVMMYQSSADGLNDILAIQLFHPAALSMHVDSV